MAKLVIVNGAPGVGKSTVAEIVFSGLSNAAFLDGDDVWRIRPFEVNDRTKAIVGKNIPFVLRSYLEAAYDYVLLAWVMHRQEIIDAILEALSDLEFDLHVFTLVAEEGVLCERWRSRAGKQAVPELVGDRLRQSRRLRTTQIDTTGMEPDEVADRILASVAGPASPAG